MYLIAKKLDWNALSTLDLPLKLVQSLFQCTEVEHFHPLRRKLSCSALSAVVSLYHSALHFVGLHWIGWASDVHCIELCEYPPSWRHTPPHIIPSVTPISPVYNIHNTYTHTQIHIYTPHITRIHTYTPIYIVCIIHTLMAPTHNTQRYTHITQPGYPSMSNWWSFQYQLGGCRKAWRLYKKEEKDS